MKHLLKGKFGTVVILFFTLILAGVAIFTAVRLYQLRSQPVAPNVPSSIPHAQEATPTPACDLTFTVTTSTASPTETPGPTGTPNSCGGTCGSNYNCQGGFYCYQGFCRNPSCPAETDCSCPSGTVNPTPTPTLRSRTTAPTPTAPSLPNSGTDWPTVAGAGVGIFVVIGSLLLAL